MCKECIKTRFHKCSESCWTKKRNHIFCICIQYILLIICKPLKAVPSCNLWSFYLCFDWYNLLFFWYCNPFKSHFEIVVKITLSIFLQMSCTVTRLLSLRNCKILWRNIKSTFTRGLVFETHNNCARCFRIFIWFEGHWTPFVLENCLIDIFIYF